MHPSPSGDSLVRVLAFSGSTREGSFNKKLLRVAVDAAEAEGASVTWVDLRQYPLPLYDGDLERREGLPEPARRLRELFLSHPAFLIAAPEYNGSVSGVLKNTVDWLSRPIEGETELTLSCYRGKIAALLSASPGPLGGIRGLMHLREILSGIGVLVIPESSFIRDASREFDEAGRLRSAPYRQRTEMVGRRLVQVARGILA